MNDHPVAALLPGYAAGALDPEAHQQVEAHVRGCGACRAEVAEWWAIGAATVSLAVAVGEPSPELFARVEARLAEAPALGFAPAALGRATPVRALVQLVSAQVPLVRTGLWLAAPLVFAVGAVLAVTAGSEPASAMVFALWAPAVAAVGVALVYGPDNDPGLELALATPTSPRTVLLARLALVVGYDLALALLANAMVTLVEPGLAYWPLVGLWLAPMAVLSAGSLLVSLVTGPAVAIAAALTVWSTRVLTLAPDPSTGLDALADRLWDTVLSGPAAWMLAAALALVALWLAPRTQVRS